MNHNVQVIKVYRIRNKYFTKNQRVDKITIYKFFDF